NGKRVSLKEAGAQVTFPEDRAPLPTSGVDKSRLRFRIQVGTFAGNVPVDMMGRYLELGDVMAVPTASSVRYLFGNFTTRAEAEAARKELAAKGFADAFLVGDLDGRIITADDAQRLLSEP
ncbi:MAG TPA: SPOR domain-containing protein, partial [Flavobacteriales bacterium]|nr:SPOR domain-containing protein [Flavobacteriales bacterium]